MKKQKKETQMYCIKQLLTLSLNNDITLLKL